MKASCTEMGDLPGDCEDFVVREKQKFAWTHSERVTSHLAYIPHPGDQRGYQHSCASSRGCSGVHPLTNWDHHKQLGASLWG